MVNGPNLNLLGVREPDVYGTTTLSDLERQVAAWGSKLGLEVSSFQSNHEGAIIDRLHQAREDADGLVLNLGAFTHSSYALHDAIVASELPAVEIHISNIMRREAWRRHSVTAPACLYAIYGRGVIGYRDALRILRTRASSPVETIEYGDHQEQVIDVRSPVGPGPHPVAVFLHGGFWRSEWTRDTMDGLAADLAHRGWLTANVEYRRLDVGGGWPASFEDVLTAIRLARVQPNADPTRLTLIGHSAGSHLALLAAPEVDADTVVGLASLTDLRSTHESGVGDDSIARFVGRSPTETYAALLSTKPHVSARTILVHGTADHLVPVEQSRRFAAAHPATLIELEDVGHFELLDPARKPWRQVLEMLEQ